MKNGVRQHLQAGARDVRTDRTEPRDSVPSQVESERLHAQGSSVGSSVFGMSLDDRGLSREGSTDDFGGRSDQREGKHHLPKAVRYVTQEQAGPGLFRAGFAVAPTTETAVERERDPPHPGLLTDISSDWASFEAQRETDRTGRRW